MKYVRPTQFEEEGFEIAVATTTEKIKQLGSMGCVKYDEKNGIGYYTKPKKYGV